MTDACSRQADGLGQGDTSLTRAWREPDAPKSTINLALSPQAEQLAVVGLIVPVVVDLQLATFSSRDKA